MPIHYFSFMSGPRCISRSESGQRVGPPIKAPCGYRDDRILGPQWGPRVRLVCDEATSGDALGVRCNGCASPMGFCLLKSQNLTETTPTCSDKEGVFIKDKKGHGSKRCGNNPYCCSDKGVALAKGGRNSVTLLQRWRHYCQAPTLTLNCCNSGSVSSSCNTTSLRAWGAASSSGRSTPRSPQSECTGVGEQGIGASQASRVIPQPWAQGFERWAGGQGSF